MKNKFPYYYKDFNCIADKCTDTCCAGWEIIIDEDTLSKYKKVTGPFGERLNKTLTKYSDGEEGFELVNDNCPFLNKTGFCDIYSNLGEDHLCYTCRQFPRFTDCYGDIRETGISISCPEAARLILKDKDKVTFYETHDDEVNTSSEFILPELLDDLFKARDEAIDIIQDRSIDFNKRITLLLSFTDEIQQLMDNDDFEAISDIRKKYLDDDFRKNFSVDISNDTLKDKITLMKEYFAVFMNLDPINEDWPKIMQYAFIKLFVKNASNFDDIHIEFKEYIKDREYEFEHFIVYFIYRYFLESLYDYDLSPKIKLAVISYIMVRELDIVRYIDNNKSFSFDDQVDIMHIYSKEIEHSEENMADLADMFNKKRIFTIDMILSLL